MPIIPQSSSAPNAIAPNAIAPNVIAPNVIAPNVIAPNVIEPNVIEPNVIAPNVIEPNVIEPNAIALRSISQKPIPPNAIPQLRINAERLLRNLNHLATMGQLDNGGVCRLAFSPEDIAARQWVVEQMEQAGMAVQVDAAGNVIGRYAGACAGFADLPAFATGSHIDTVPVGGKFDGCLGVLAGIEVVHTLREHGLRLRRPLEVIVFSDEERSMIGSKAIAGDIENQPQRYARLDGTPIQQSLALVGGDWGAIASAQRPLAAFVELHVEQGGVLEKAGAEIGVVTGVVGQQRFAVQIQGQPNHAGTTPMGDRQDALVAAAHVVLAVNRLATETPGEQVATVGHLTVSPNATNTIAGQVALHIDLRDLSSLHLQRLVEAIAAQMAQIADQTQTQITWRSLLAIQPTLADPRIMQTLERVALGQNLTQIKLPSRAGHDAQEVGRKVPMGMIFVPSQAGISHSEREFTTAKHCAQGANVLLQSLMELDQIWD
jgi:beta-ureidopropionase / N-carbamoyl-L-amino-acid hydrolase